MNTPALAGVLRRPWITTTGFVGSVPDVAGEVTARSEVSVGVGERMINVGCESHMADALIAAHRLMELAEKQGTECGHDGCLLLDGILRDCAMQILRVVADSTARLVISPGHPDDLESQPAEWPRKAVGAHQ